LKANLRVLAFSFEGKYNENAIYQKLSDLDLSKEEAIAKILRKAKLKDSIAETI
jgi:predicted RNA-binding protein Jag